MVNSLMIKVSWCQRLLSNNACLCFFIKTSWYTWKLYRGNWSKNVQNVTQTQTWDTRCDRIGSSSLIWTNLVNLCEPQHVVQRQKKKKTPPCDSEAFIKTRNPSFFLISSRRGNSESPGLTQTRTCFMWWYIAFATEYAFSISIINTTLGRWHHLAGG